MVRKLGVFFLVLLSFGLSRAAQAEPVRWQDLPPAAQHSITMNAQGFKTYMIEKETVQGVLMYEAIVIKKDGSKIILMVGSLGQIFEVRSRATLF